MINRAGMANLNYGNPYTQKTNTKTAYGAVNSKNLFSGLNQQIGISEAITTIKNILPTLKLTNVTKDAVSYYKDYKSTGFDSYMLQGGEGKRHIFIAIGHDHQENVLRLSSGSNHLTFKAETLQEKNSLNSVKDALEKKADKEL